MRDSSGGGGAAALQDWPANNIKKRALMGY